VRIAIVGFGLIGGSIARAIRLRQRSESGEPTDRLAAWSPGGDGPAAALSAGLVDAAPPELAATIDGAELVILAAPPLACLDLIDELGGPLAASLGPDATVTDVASTKGAIVARADHAGLRFVGGHPMAGLETPGFAAAREDLFVGRPWVVCRGAGAGEPDLARVAWLVQACGAVAHELDPATHDRLVAAISHLPLVASAALVEAVTAGPDWPAAAGLAAGGWRSMTRLAAGDPTMAAGIAATNPVEIAAGLRALRATLDEWLAALEPPGPDAGDLADRFDAARRRIEAG